MKKYLFTLLLVSQASADFCDNSRIYESDDLLLKVDCKSLKYIGCVAKGYTLSGREYLTMSLKDVESTKLVQMTKWLDTPNNEYAQSWEASRMIKIVNLSTSKSSKLVSGYYWKVQDKMQVIIKDRLGSKVDLSAELNCQ